MVALGNAPQIDTGNAAGGHLGNFPMGVTATAGPPGPEGPEGPQGPVGPEGPAGAGNPLPEVIPPGVTVTDGSLSHPQTAIFTPPVTAIYRLDVYLVVVSPGSAGDIRVELHWIDDSDLGRAVQVGTTSVATKGYIHGSYVIQAKAGIPVNYSTTIFNNATGARIWHLYIIVEKLS